MAKLAGLLRQQSLHTSPRPREIFATDKASDVPPDTFVKSEQPLLSPVSQVTHGERQNYNPEFWHTKFRSFSPLEGWDPIHNLRIMSELCHQWLRPDLNSKEEILDLLVLEKFLICMPPELQILVKESGVRSCQDLERMLTDRKPLTWSTINLEGQTYLLQNSIKVEAAEGENAIDLSLSKKSQGSLHRGQASLKLNLEEPPSRQKEDILQVLIHERKQPDCLRPEQSLGKVPAFASVIPAQGPGLTVTSTRGHTRERPFKCNLCNKAFLQSYNLRVHQRVHTGEKPYLCAVCGKEFTQGSTLQSHSRVHMKEKPYACNSCGHRFRYKGNLTAHLRIHYNLKPYICKQCNASFRQQGTWKRHMKTHLRKESS